MTKEEIVAWVLEFMEKDPYTLANFCAGITEQFDAGELTRESVLESVDKIHNDADTIRAAFEPILDEVLKAGRTELTARSVVQAAAESIEANSAEYVPPTNPLDKWGEEHWDAITALLKACEGFFTAAGKEANLDTEANSILESARVLVQSGAIDILKEWTPIKDRWGS